MIALIDYGAGNLRSVERALTEAGGDVRRVRTPEELADADRIVLPGVGHFAQAMNSLRAQKLDGALRERVIEDKIPYLGLCLGLQLLFESSEEAPGVRGLGWLAGTIRKFQPGVKIPHMGWNDISFAFRSSAGGRVSDDRTAPEPEGRGAERGRRDRGQDPLTATGTDPFRGLTDHPFFYFVHSYFAQPADPSIVAASADYPNPFCCAVQHENIFAVQFHPEKSQTAGRLLLKNLLVTG